MRVYAAWLFGALMAIAFLLFRNSAGKHHGIEVVHMGSDTVDATAPSILALVPPQSIMAFDCLNKRARPPPHKGFIWSECEPLTRPLRRLLTVDECSPTPMRCLGRKRTPPGWMGDFAMKGVCHPAP